MKRFFCVIIVFLLLFSTLSAFADSNIDLSGMSFDELKDLQSKVNTALWASDGWKEVEVPRGIYEIGKEIPAGKWTLRCSNKGAYYTAGTKLVGGEVRGLSFYGSLAEGETVSFIFEEGMYLEVSYEAIIFTPYVLSFSFD